MSLRMKTAQSWGVVSTGAAEAATIFCRATTGIAAADIPTSTHWLLRLHHMFWRVPLLAALPVFWKSERVSGRLIGLSAGLVFSDLVHHFLVLPLWVGNTAGDLDRPG